MSDLGAPDFPFGWGDLTLATHDLLELLPRCIAQSFVPDVSRQNIRTEIGDGEAVIVNAFLGDRKLFRRAGPELHFEAIGGSGGFGRLTVQKLVARAPRMLDDQGLGLLIHVVDVICFCLDGGGARGENARRN